MSYIKITHHTSTSIPNNTFKGGITQSTAVYESPFALTKKKSTHFPYERRYERSRSPIDIERRSRSPYAHRYGRSRSPKRNIHHYSPERHAYVEKLASNPHPFGITEKEVIVSPGLSSSEIRSTGRKDQFDDTFGKIYDCKYLGHYDEVPKYRWDGGFKDQIRDYMTPEKIINRRLFDQSTADHKTHEGYYS